MINDLYELLESLDNFKETNTKIYFFFYMIRIVISGIIKIKDFAFNEKNQIPF